RSATSSSPRSSTPHDRFVIGAFRVCELPVRAEREQLAVLVHAVDEHAVRAELLAARERVDYRTRERALVARRVRLRIVEADLALRDRVVPERRDRGLAGVALAGGVGRRRPDRVLDHAVLGEQVEPPLALPVRHIALGQETRAARGVIIGHRGLTSGPRSYLRAAGRRA